LLLRRKRKLYFTQKIICFTIKRVQFRFAAIDFVQIAELDTSTPSQDTATAAPSEVDGDYEVRHLSLFVDDKEYRTLIMCGMHFRRW
jgi:hypothetical protein